MGKCQKCERDTKIEFGCGQNHFLCQKCYDEKETKSLMCIQCETQPYTAFYLIKTCSGIQKNMLDHPADKKGLFSKTNTGKELIDFFGEGVLKFQDVPIRESDTLDKYFKAGETSTLVSEKKKIGA